MEKKTDTTKKALKKSAAKAPAVKKARAKKEEVADETVVTAALETPVEKTVEKASKPAKKAGAFGEGRYVFATGRRKTSIANVRLFVGGSELQVNRKAFEVYFFDIIDRDKAMRPFEVTGTANDFHFYATINGGGIHSQAEALSHGIAQALAEANPEVRLVLKKNGLLTRDDRKKERKKPGLRRARRAPQWAKR
jgi:small subunit ribosomal protein S9